MGRVWIRGMREPEGSPQLPQVEYKVGKENTSSKRQG